MLPGGPLNLSTSEDLDRLARRDLDDRLLPARPPAADHPTALRLAFGIGDVDRPDMNVEQLLDRLPHLRPVRVRVDLERVLVVLDQGVALLRDDRSEQDLVRFELHARSFELPARA